MAKANKKPSAAGEEPIPIITPDILRELRQFYGKMTQEEAAKRLDVPPRTWISWENSQRKPSRFAVRVLKSTFPEYFKAKKI